IPINYIPYVEDHWSEKCGESARRPAYVVSSITLMAVPQLLTMLGTFPDVMSRISGSRNLLDDTLEANTTSYRIRYRNAFNFTNPDGNQGGYDAFYSLLYANAAATASASLLDGPHVSAGFENLVGGTNVVDVGPVQLSDAIGLLSNRATIDL